VQLRLVTRQARLIFVAFSVIYVIATRGHFVGTMEISPYQTTRSLWEHGDMTVGWINDTYHGRGGNVYSQFSPGIQFATLPLYGLGKIVHKELSRTGDTKWTSALAGPSLGEEPRRWGGDIEIFFVDLFNAFVTALLCAVFFVFSVRLGTAPKWALIATSMLGLTTHVVVFSTGLLQHPSECLLLLLTFYLLFRDADKPDRRLRLWAGAVAGIMILFRMQSVIAIPFLGAYHLWGLWRHTPEGNEGKRWLLAVQRAVPTILCMIPGIALHLVVNYIRFESITGVYNNEGFGTPLWKGLYGLLLSPGMSIFVYTPLLLLTPLTLPNFFKNHRAEALLVLSLTLAYLVFFGRYTKWHGSDINGPRYMVPLVPLLLLPLGGWMERIGRRAWIAVAPLALIGFWVQLVHVSTNMWYVFAKEHYDAYGVGYGFMFTLRDAPLVGMSKGFLAHDYRVDTWLVNVYRSAGVGTLLVILVPLLALLAITVWKLRESFQTDETPLIATPQSFRPGRHVAVACGIWMGCTLGLKGIDSGLSPAEQPTAKTEETSEQSNMKTGLELLYQQHDADGAAEKFREVLTENPNHYGAQFQLATALDRLGRYAESRPIWERVATLARSYNDSETLNTARAHLDQQ
jgi:hypothetical protein